MEGARRARRYRGGRVESAQCWGGPGAPARARWAPWGWSGPVRLLKPQHQPSLLLHSMCFPVQTTHAVHLTVSPAPAHVHLWRRCIQATRGFQDSGPCRLEGTPSTREHGHQDAGTGCEPGLPLTLRPSRVLDPARCGDGEVAVLEKAPQACWELGGHQVHSLLQEGPPPRAPYPS